MIDTNSLAYPLLLDGGLSNQLEAQGHDLNDKLWSAKLLVKNPGAIFEAHMTYLNAGADILITSSYQATVQGFLDNFHISEEEAREFLINTTDIARHAIIKHQQAFGTETPKYVAASIGPYGAYLADGSEYSGNYGISDDELYDFHKSRMELLAHTEPDFFAIETIPSFQEAKVLNNLIQESEIPAWLSFSCKSGTEINDGSRFAVALKLLEDNLKIFAVGINCTAPQHVSTLIEIIKSELPEKKVVVYPNSGEVYDPESKTWSGLNDPRVCAMMSNEWMNLGADIIGGCCRIGPTHIASIKAVMESR